MMMQQYIRGMGKLLHYHMKEKITHILRLKELRFCDNIVNIGGVSYVYRFSNSFNFINSCSGVF